MKRPRKIRPALDCRHCGWPVRGFRAWLFGLIGVELDVCEDCLTRIGLGVLPLTRRDRGL